MKRIYSVFKAIRILVILFGIPLMIIELFRPGLLDFSTAWSETFAFGWQTDLIQAAVVVSELVERISKLKETKFHLFSARWVPMFRRLKF